ncbi:MAG: M949_RS01915 family surface polysaccharide biosynthesis protein [Chitinophagaceae bacterium]
MFIRFNKYSLLIITIWFSVACSSAPEKQVIPSDDEEERSSDDQDSKKSGSIRLRSISKDEVPSGIAYNGKIDKAFTWNDNNGENILLLTSKEKQSIDEYQEYMNSIYIFAYNYVKKDKGHELLWKMNDQVLQCPTDAKCEFLEGSTTLTDLDKDGFGEVKLQYELGCISDVRPYDMKLLFYENGQKRALRGLRWIDMDALQGKRESKYPFALDDMAIDPNSREPDYYHWGKYKTEADFKNDPIEFLEYARLEWRKYVM